MTTPLTFLITGGAGFIGSHLAEAALAAGYRVLAIDDLSTGSLHNLTHLQGQSHFHFARASITDHIVMDRLSSQADVVVHLAAAVGVQLVVQHPVHTIETNVRGTEEVLRTALRYGCRVLLASTSEVYGKGRAIPLREDDDVLLGATSKSRWSYAASKMVDECLALAYYHEYHLPVVIGRFFNTVGPRQSGRYGMVLPRLMQQALGGEPLTVYGDGLQTRCFCDVRDVVQALLGLATHPEACGHVYNIGSTEEITIRELAERVKACTGSNAPLVYLPYADAYAEGFEDLQRRVPDISRIQALLGWQPRAGLEDILQAVMLSEKQRLAATPPSSG